MNMLFQNKRFYFFVCIFVFNFYSLAEQIKEGSIFPDLNDFQLEGELPKDYKEKIVLIDFWASWCGPCKKSFPVYDSIYKKYIKNDFLIIAISVDEKQEDFQKFLKNNPVSFYLLRDPKQKLVEKCGINSMPTSIIIDKQGMVRFIHNGFNSKTTENLLIQQIEDLLK